jgi:protein TonB
MLMTIVTVVALSTGAAQNPGEELLEEAKRGRTNSIRKLLDRSSSLDVNYQDKFEVDRSSLRDSWRARENRLLASRTRREPGALERGWRIGAHRGNAVSLQGDPQKALATPSVDIDAADRRGWSAYTWAAILGFEEGIDLLSRAGAKPMSPAEPLAFYTALEEGISPPRVREPARPVFTQDALDRQVQGEVLVQVLIRKDGTCLPIRVIRRLDPELDRNAVDAASRWVFEPATLNGQPVELIAEIAISFNILERK